MKKKYQPLNSLCYGFHEMFLKIKPLPAKKQTTKTFLPISVTQEPFHWETSASGNLKCEDCI